MSDNVNHPPHYLHSSITCVCGKHIEYIDITRNQSFNIGNAIKYLWRYKDKNGVEDLKKSIWYLKDQIKLGRYVFRESVCSKCLGELFDSLIMEHFDFNISRAYQVITKEMPLRLAIEAIELEISKLSTKPVDK